MANQIINVRGYPPHVKQHYDYSCWAACTESWAKADTRFAWYQAAMGIPPADRVARPTEEDLIEHWGQGPDYALPVADVSAKYCTFTNTTWRAFDHTSTHTQFAAYVELYLPLSHIMCIYTVGGTDRHAVLMFKRNLTGTTYMDPATPGQYWNGNDAYFMNRRPLIMIRMTGP